MERSGFAVPLQHNLGLQRPCADSLCLTVQFKTELNIHQYSPGLTTLQWVSWMVLSTLKSYRLVKRSSAK